MKPDKTYTEDVAKYKKKSKKSGLKRSKHKHQNIYVRLYEDRPKYTWHRDYAIGKVCTICGRIDNIYFGSILDWKPDYILDLMTEEDFKNLPAYRCESYFGSGGKFAYKEEA